MRRIKTDLPSVYQTFLALLKAYDMKLKTITQVHTQIVWLFDGHPDFLRSIRPFLPDLHEDAAPVSEDDGEVEVMGERTLDERNALGFANAIVIDSDEDESQPEAGPPIAGRASIKPPLRRSTRVRCPRFVEAALR